MMRAESQRQTPLASCIDPKCRRTELPSVVHRLAHLLWLGTSGVLSKCCYSIPSWALGGIPRQIICPTPLGLADDTLAHSS